MDDALICAMEKTHLSQGDLLILRTDRLLKNEDQKEIRKQLGLLTAKARCAGAVVVLLEAGFRLQVARVDGEAIVEAALEPLWLRPAQSPSQSAIASAACRIRQWLRSLWQ